MNNNWTQLWLNYSPKKDMGNKAFFHSVCISDFDRTNPMVASALEELKNGIFGMLSLSVNETTELSEEGGVLLRKVSACEGKKEGFHLYNEDNVMILEAIDENGLLYGVFRMLRQIAMEEPLKGIDEVSAPENPMRMLNHWDNMDGSIERGYSGKSFFFEDNDVCVNERTKDYARFMASIGINASVINNVNVKDAATYLITDRFFDKVAAMAEIFGAYGIRFYLSLNYAACMELGGLPGADPLDPQVIAWWQKKMAEVFAKIPNLGGFLVKADSEGRPGPFTYGRTQADGANMLADIVKPYGGIIIWRCFVYNCTQDWRDYKTDRARAGYDNFITMDGDYHDNVILQIKNGPMDFQIREPISPLLGGLKKTNQMLEVQIAQEYTGQQIDLCYLIPMFKEVLSFKTYCKEKNDTVADIISGRTFGNRNAGFAAVCNTGNDANWTGNDLAAANLYGFGRLAFDMTLSAEQIANEWIRLTFGNDAKVVDTLTKLLCNSRAIYEKYTAPLGIGWMVNPSFHYGPSVDGYEYSRWGTYHRADHKGIGVDRSDKGTGYAMQYNEPNASMYNKPETCPEELVLFFHHLPYTYVLSTGKTLIQHIYDSHFEGVEEVEKMIEDFEGLKGLIPDNCFDLIRDRFSRQLLNAKEWRDQVNSYFYRKTGIEDEKGRMIYQ